MGPGGKRNLLFSRKEASLYESVTIRESVGLQVCWKALIGTLIEVFAKEKSLTEDLSFKTKNAAFAPFLVSKRCKLHLFTF